MAEEQILKFAPQKKGQKTQANNFQEIKKVFEKADILQNQIDTIKKISEKINNIILKKWDEEPTLQMGELTTPKDEMQGKYKLMIYDTSKKVFSGGEGEKILGVAHEKIIKECASIIGRNCITLQTKKENELNDLLTQLKNL